MLTKLSTCMRQPEEWSPSSGLQPVPLAYIQVEHP
jgi:hypothetical protein